MAALYFTARQQGHSVEIKNGLSWALMLVALQILLGILTVLLHVQNRGCTGASSRSMLSLCADDSFHPPDLRSMEITSNQTKAKRNRA